MKKYRAIISIEFDDDDLQQLADEHDVDVSRMDPSDVMNGELDNMSFGNHWVEQIFCDGKPTIRRLSGGIKIEVNPHD